MRQEAVLQPNNVDMRKLQSLATVHRNQRHGVPGLFLFLGAIIVQCNILQERLELIHRQNAPRASIHRDDQFFQVSNAIAGRLDIFFGSLQFIVIANFTQECVGPVTQFYSTLQKLLAVAFEQADKCV